MIELSVILISKNQEWNIARLVESVLEQLSDVQSKEVMLVDSASSDQTVDIARNYPIRILRLAPDQPLTPSAGRYIGYINTSGKFILFLDGDMELCSGWLELAQATARRISEAAVFTGFRIECSKTGLCDDHDAAHQQVNPEASTIEVTDVNFAGGAAMYRRSVLEQVGTFNPYLQSDEEPELCMRIRHAGYRVLSLDYPIVYHYSDPIEELSTLVGRWKRGLYLGFGQNFRYHLKTGMLWPYLKLRGHGCVPVLGIGAGVASLLLSVLTQRWIWFGLWWLALALIVVGDAIRKGSIHRTVYSLLHRILIADGMIRGFLKKPLAPSSYPQDVERVL
jgi:glycosyltransferase involved in cell wall biosynthesis